jgi:hypothetical protein
MTIRHERTLWFLVFAVALFCLVYGTWQCGKRLGQFMRSGAVTIEEVQ